jgi:hypothetical protein
MIEAKGDHMTHQPPQLPRETERALMAEWLDASALVAENDQIIGAPMVEDVGQLMRVVWQAALSSQAPAFAGELTEAIAHIEMMQASIDKLSSYAGGTGNTDESSEIVTRLRAALQSRQPDAPADIRSAQIEAGEAAVVASLAGTGLRWGAEPADHFPDAGDMVAPPVAPVAPVAAVPDILSTVGALIKTQDNRFTDQPMFVVQQKRTYVTEDGYNNCRHEWRETESGEYSEADEQQAEQLERAFQDDLLEPDGWKRFAVFDVWEFVTACFTERGCKDFIAINGHNLKEPRIYAEGSYRNHEFQDVRKALIACASPTPPVQPDDTRRLDWLQSVARCDPKMDGNHVWWPLSFNVCSNLKGPNLRAAIDAAQAEGRRHE